MRPLPPRFRALLAAFALGAMSWPALANTSGVAATGDDVTVKDNGDGTVTMANGLVTILIETAANRINSIKYTSNNSGAPRTVETIKDNDHFRWGGSPLGGATFVYSLAIDPATNGGACGDVMLLNSSADKGVFEVHSPGAGLGDVDRRLGRAEPGAGGVRMDDPQSDAPILGRRGRCFRARDGRA
jgi:hypothetical protein